MAAWKLSANSLFSLVFFLNSTEFTLDTATAEKKEKKERMKKTD